jgi:hypothetical protein
MLKPSTPANTPANAGHPQSRIDPTATPDAGQNGLTAEFMVEATQIPTKEASATHAAATVPLAKPAESGVKKPDAGVMGRSEQIMGRHVNAIE